MASNYEIISKKQVSLTEVLETINNKPQEQELTYREEKIKEYLKNRNKVSYEQFKEIKEKIENLEISRLEEQHIIKIVDIMPENGTQLRSLVQNTGVIIVDDIANNILEILNNYRN